MRKSDKCHLIIAGAQKSGTTWMHNTLEYQDEFWCPIESQEVHFFDRFYDRGYKKYEKLYKKAHRKKITLDNTPDYLCHPLFPNRLDRYDKICKRPIKIIVILRNPIKRAISAYKMKVKKDGYNLKLSSALKVDSTLVNKSKYYKALSKLKYYFGEKVKVLVTEEVFNDSSKALRDIENFVGANKKIINIYKNVKINSSSKKKTHPLVQTGSKLLRYFGGQKLIHEVKKSGLARFLRRDASQGAEPVVDAKGVRFLKRELTEEVKRVDKLIDRPDVINLWNMN